MSLSYFELLGKKCYDLLNDNRVVRLLEGPGGSTITQGLTQVHFWFLSDLRICAVYNLQHILAVCVCAGLNNIPPWHASRDSRCLEWPRHLGEGMWLLQQHTSANYSQHRSYLRFVCLWPLIFWGGHCWVGITQTIFIRPGYHACHVQATGVHDASSRSHAMATCNFHLITRRVCRVNQLVS